MKALSKGFCLLIFTCFPALFLQLYFAGNWYAIGHSYSLGMLFGIVAFCYMALVLVLATRVRLLDALFGQDRVIRLHGYFAFVAIVFGAVHMVLKQEYIYEKSTQLAYGANSFMLLGVLLIITVLFMIGKELPLIKYAVHLVQKLIPLDYSVAKVLHNGFALVLFFLTLHIFYASATQESHLRMYAMAGLGGGALLRYFYFFHIKRLFPKRYALTSVCAETPSVVTLSFEQESGKSFSFTPGQFLYLKLKGIGISGEVHPFTISSSPQESLSVTIKALGNYTAKLQHIQSGAKAIIDGPYGLFTPTLNGRPKLFVAGGIGITPFLSVLKNWEHAAVNAPVTLLWSVQKGEELFVLEVLKRLSQTSWFTFELFVTREAYEGKESRRIDNTSLSTHLTDSPECYLCGPERLRKAVVQTLRRQGVPRRDIHFERFRF